VAGSTDVEWTSGSGPISGAGNIAQDTVPAVAGVIGGIQPRWTLTVDDSDDAGCRHVLCEHSAAVGGMRRSSSGSCDYGGVSAGADASGGVSKDGFNAGRDLSSHSISHTYYTNTVATGHFSTREVGTRRDVSISNKTLTITADGSE